MRKKKEERTKKTKGIQAEGVVVQALPNAMFRVQLDSGPEVLAHISGLFAGRGFNIDSLAVGETEDPAVSRMTIVAEGDEHDIGLPEDVPAPQLFIGGRQSVDEALAHATEILAEETGEEEGELDEADETADTEEESAGTGDGTVDAAEEADAEGGEEPEEEPSSLE